MTMIYPWQVSEWQLLQSQMTQQRMPHALLFCGQAGMGKYDLAVCLAKRMLCLKASDSPDCECRSCQLFQSQTHPDFYQLTLQEKSKIIKIDQVRELVDQLNQSSYLGGYQVTIIHPAESMNRQAANALLKTLEEPAGAVLFILVTHQLGRLPVTIVSRCQKIFFSAKSDEITLQWLSERVNSDVNVKQLLTIAENAPLKALSLVELNYLSLRDELLKGLIQIRQKQSHPIHLVESYLKQDILLWLTSLISLLSDLSRLQLGVNKRYLVNQDCLCELKKLGQGITSVALHQYIQTVFQSRQLFLTSLSLNTQLLLENLLLEWMKLPSC